MVQIWCTSPQKLTLFGDNQQTFIPA